MNDSLAIRYCEAKDRQGQTGETLDIEGQGGAKDNEIERERDGDEDTVRDMERVREIERERGGRWR